jgi:DNA-binding SARP family transcriptional activator
VHLLNGFRITDLERTVHLPTSAQRVAAFLAVRGTPLRRSYVAGTLWADSSEERATASLRSALWRLRRPGCALVEANATEVWLGSAVRVDLHAAVETARRILGDRFRLGRQRVERALDLLGFDLLVDRWDDEWVMVERESFRQLRLHALERLCERLVEAGAPGVAVQVGLAAVDGEPLRESAHRALIRAYAAEGNPAEAIRQYRRCRQLLRDELEVLPSSATEDLMRLLSSRGVVAS